MSTLHMCGFPLGEERKKGKMFFSHTAGSMGSSVPGGGGGVFRSRGVSEFSCFVAFHYCLTFPTHPPSMCFLVVVGFQVPVVP